MAVKILPYDSAEFLKTDSARTDYLNLALEEGDPGVIGAALGTIARSRNMMARIAGETGLGEKSLYKSLSEKGNPGIGTVVKVAKALGYELTVVRAKPLAKPARKAAPRRRASA